MSEQNEINLRRAQQEWQARQNSSGTLAMAMCAATVGGFLYFFCAPSVQSAGLLAVLMAMLMAVCIRMLNCAAKVVEVRNTLQPVRVQSEVIDVEVVDSPRHQTYRQLPPYA